MRLVIKRRSKLPKCIRRFMELKGICVGQCINPKSKIEDDCDAHAHSNYFDLNRGFICVRYKYHLREKYLLLHEVAHLIVNKTENIPHHGKAWKKVVAEIGGTYLPYPSYNNKRVHRGYYWYDDL